MVGAVVGYETAVMGGRTGSALAPRGDDATTIAALWWFMLVLGVAVFVLFAVALVLGLRRSAPDDSGSSRRTSRWIVGGGVVLPVVVIAIVLGATLVAMRQVAATDDEAELTVEVIGHQYWWEVRYPDTGVVSANEVHIPAHTPVEITLTSADVIHSWWVPAVAGKMDLLPERINRLVVEAEPGEYQGRCAEFCGTSHANMDFWLVVHDADGYRRWLDEQARPAAAPSSPAAERGAAAFAAAGCGACHNVSGTQADGSAGAPAPDLTHLASRLSILGGAVDGTTPDLVEWITDPHSVKPGALMPDTDLADDDIADIVAYLEELE